jgi:hypothetical protein
MQTMRKVGTLTSALTLLALGIVLLTDLVLQKPILSQVLNFWPVVILGLGGEMLWSLYSVKKQNTNEEIRVDVRSIALLSLVGIFSITLYTAQNVEGMVQSSILNVRDAFSDKTISLPDRMYDAKNVQKLEVYSSIGTIEVSKSNAPQIMIKTKVHVRNLNSQQANDEAKNWTPKITEGATFRVELDSSVAAASKINGVDLEIQLPANIALQVLANNGNVSVQDHVGDVVISAESGKIELEKIKGKTSIEQNDGQIFAKNIEGELQVKSNKGRIEVEKVTGNASLKSTYGQIRVAKIGGALRVDGEIGDVQINDVSGNVNAQTKKGLIQASHMKKEVTLASGTGGITVESEVGGSWILNSTRGMVSIRIPDRSDIEFIGESSRGLVKGPTKSDSAPTGSRVTEKMGNGTHSIVVRTEDGAITLSPNL